MRAYVAYCRKRNDLLYARVRPGGRPKNTDWPPIVQEKGGNDNKEVELAGKQNECPNVVVE
jgi:hypothetical protein